MPTWEDVVEIGTRLPGVELQESYGTPALRVSGKFMCRLREQDAVSFRVLDIEDRDALLRAYPDELYITPHFDGWPYLLARLETIGRELLSELVEDAWRVQAPKRLVAEHEGPG